MKKEPNQDYPPDQRPIGKKIKIKGSPLLRDLDQVEVITEKVGGIIVKATELNNQERPGVGRLPRRPRRITLIKTTVGQKEVPNQNSKKPERTIDSPVLQIDLRQYDYLTSSNHPTTLNMMARPKPRQWLRIYSQSIELAGGTTISRPCSFPWP